MSQKQDKFCETVTTIFFIVWGIFFLGLVLVLLHDKEIFLGPLLISVNQLGVVWLVVCFILATMCFIFPQGDGFASALVTVFWPFIIPPGLVALITVAVVYWRTTGKWFFSQKQPGGGDEPTLEVS